MPHFTATLLPALRARPVGWANKQNRKCLWDTHLFLSLHRGTCNKNDKQIEKQHQQQPCN